MGIVGRPLVALVRSGNPERLDMGVLPLEVRDAFDLKTLLQWMVEDLPKVSVTDASPVHPPASQDPPSPSRPRRDTSRSP